MKNLSLLLLFLFPYLLQAQPGCTDPQATNYNPDATVNDGSCLYPITDYAPIEIAPLPADLEECSGLAFFDEQLWTQLDGGNLDRIYTLDTMTAQKLETITVPNADNHDWEDLADDDEHLYIGDFGNNAGNRTDLRIYKIKKTDLAAGTISPELIEFSYSDQTVFVPMQNANNYDCEAFFFWQDSLHLFSKNWADFKTRHYVLPTTPGGHVAELRDSLEVQGQITAADISEDGAVSLLGYNVSTGLSFVWLLFDFEGSHFFSGNKRKISIGGALTVGQPEGIVFRDLTRGYICSERLSIIPQKLMYFDFLAYLENPINSTSQEANAEHQFSVFPNPANEVLNLSIENWPVNSDITLTISDATGKVIMEKFYQNMLNINMLKIDISHFQSGNYLARIEGDGVSAIARLAKF